MCQSRATVALLKTTQIMRILIMGKVLLDPRGTTVTDAANHAGVSRPTIYKAIKDGRLQAKKVGKRSIILPEWVDAWLNDAPDAREGLV